MPYASLLVILAVVVPRLSGLANLSSWQLAQPRLFLVMANATIAVTRTPSMKVPEATPANVARET